MLCLIDVNLKKSSVSEILKRKVSKKFFFDVAYSNIYTQPYQEIALRMQKTTKWKMFSKTLDVQPN